MADELKFPEGHGDPLQRLVNDGEAYGRQLRASGAAPPAGTSRADDLLAEREKMAEAFAATEGSTADRKAWQRTAEAIRWVRAALAGAASPSEKGPNHGA
jgi:hypothetical protein